MARTSIFERCRNASRDQLLHHAHNLETEMRILAKLLEDRDNQGMRTTTSAEAVNRAQALTQVAVADMGEVA
jgi:predicted transcriptional regulator